MDFEPASDEFCELMRHLNLVHCCRVVAAREPDQANVLLDTADHHSSEANALLMKLKRLPVLQDRRRYRRG